MPLLLFITGFNVIPNNGRIFVYLAYDRVASIYSSLMIINDSLFCRTVCGSALWDWKTKRSRFPRRHGLCLALISILILTEPIWNWKHPQPSPRAFPLVVSFEEEIGCYGAPVLQGCFDNDTEGLFFRCIQAGSSQLFDFHKSTRPRLDL